MLYTGVYQATRVLGSYVLSTANLYLYARLTPRPAMLAHVFT
jgi:hypothetical protein